MEFCFSNWLGESEQADLHECYYLAEQFAHFVLPFLDGSLPNNPFLEETAEIANDSDTDKWTAIKEKLNHAARTIRTKAMLDAGDEIPEGLEPPSEKEIQQAKKNFELLYPLIKKFVAKRARSSDEFKREAPGQGGGGLVDELANDLWTRSYEWLVRPKKTGWAPLPSDFVHWIAGSANRELLKFISKRKTALSPPSFVTDSESSKLNSQIKKVKKQLASTTDEKEKESLQQVLQSLNQQKNSKAGVGRPDVIQAGGDPAMTGGWSGGQRRGGRGIEGDENEQSARALTQSVTGGSDGPTASVGSDGVPGRGNPEGIPGQFDVQDFNYDLLNRALSDLASQKGRPTKWGWTTPQLMAICWKLKYGIDKEGGVGQSAKNLPARLDYIRQKGQKSGAKLAGDNWSVPKDKRNVTVFHPSWGDPQTKAIHWPISDASVIASELVEMVWGAAEDGQLPGNLVGVEPPSPEMIRTWLARSKSFLQNWLLPPEKRKDNYDIRGSLKFSGRNADKETGKEPAGSIDYSTAGMADGEQGQNSRGWKAGRFSHGGGSLMWHTMGKLAPDEEKAFRDGLMAPKDVFRLMGRGLIDRVAAREYKQKWDARHPLHAAMQSTYDEL